MSASSGSLVVVTPTFDEAANLRALAEGVFEAAPDARLLIVDDASPDGTADLARSLAAEGRRIELLSRPRKLGLGTAYANGFALALRMGAGTIVQMDADGSHDPAAIPALLSRLIDADLAIGSRYAPGGATHGWSLRRRLLSRGANAAARAATGLCVRDLTSGFRAWRASALRTLDLSAAAPKGYAFQIATTVRAAQGGLRIVEVPILFRERAGGRSKLGHGVVLEAAGFLVSTWLARRRGPSR